MLLLTVVDGHDSWWAQFIEFLKILAIWFAIVLFCVLLGIGIWLVCRIIFGIYNWRFWGARNIELFSISKYKGVGDTEESNQVCTICIEPYHEGEHTRMLLCRNFFHDSCYILWMRRSRTYPICCRLL